MNLLIFIMKLLTSFHNDDLWRLSIRRYGSKKYRINKNKFIDNILWIIFFPFIGLMLCFFVKIKLKKIKKTKMIFSVSNKVIYDRFFKKIIDDLTENSYKIEGEGYEIPNQKLQVTFIQFTKASILFLICWPIVLLTSIIYNTNFLQSIARSSYVYFKTFNFFQSNPCNLYITYQDNMCSAAFYAAFKNAGGKKLIALQNGNRVFQDYYYGSCFDHLFCASEKALDFYKDVDSIIEKYTIIGSIILMNNPELLNLKKPIIDVVFIDQGFPGTDIEKFMDFTPSNPEHFRTYLSNIKTFADKNPSLRTVYQLRHYPNEHRHLIQEALEWFNDSNVEVTKHSSKFSSYNKIQESKIVVCIDSTLGLEALSMGRPTLFVNYTKDIRDTMIPNSKLQIIYDNYDEFEKNIFRILNSDIDELLKEGYKYTLNFNDIRSQKKMVSYLDEYLANYK